VPDQSPEARVRAVYRHAYTNKVVWNSTWACWVGLKLIGFGSTEQAAWESAARGLPCPSVGLAETGDGKTDVGG
jgi:hypothetical protein